MPLFLTYSKGYIGYIGDAGTSSRSLVTYISPIGPSIGSIGPIRDSSLSLRPNRPFSPSKGKSFIEVRGYKLCKIGSIFSFIVKKLVFITKPSRRYIDLIGIFTKGG
jgi:hypothetical protein